MLKYLLALGVSCFMIAGAANAAPRLLLAGPVLPGVDIGAGLHDAGYHGGHGYHGNYHHRRHTYHRRYHAPRYRHAPRARHGYSQAHYNWCAAKYRSYNRHTNTWTAYSGKVYQCRSPY